MPQMSGAAAAAPLVFVGLRGAGRTIFLEKGEWHMEYCTVKQEASDFFIEKKSRFIGYCRPVATEEEALRFIGEIRSKHWDASHNVYAYILRENGIQRFSDDGEPQGTAGIPVIDTLKKSGVTDGGVVAPR